MGARNSAVEEIIGDKPPVLDYTEYKELKRGRFAKLATRGLELQAAIENATAELKQIRADLEPMMLSADAKSVVFGEHYVTLIEGKSAGKFDKKALAAYLINHEVPSGVVKKAFNEATTPGKEYMTVGFRSISKVGVVLDVEPDYSIYPSSAKVYGNRKTRPSAWFITMPLAPIKPPAACNVLLGTVTSGVLVKA